MSTSGETLFAALEIFEAGDTPVGAVDAELALSTSAAEAATPEAPPKSSDGCASASWAASAEVLSGDLLLSPAAGASFGLLCEEEVVGETKVNFGKMVGFEGCGTPASSAATAQAAGSNKDFPDAVARRSDSLPASKLPKGLVVDGKNLKEK